MKKLGLYIHIPFCVKKCNYCDFLSAPATRQVQKSYMQVLQKEIQKKATEYRDFTVDTIFIGGGTPTTLSAEQIKKVMDTVKENFDFPYTATSITDFWRRWHISLGTWFKEYIYKDSKIL